MIIIETNSEWETIVACISTTMSSGVILLPRYIRHGGLLGGAISFTFKFLLSIFSISIINDASQ
jgi:amino acid permease